MKRAFFFRAIELGIVCHNEYIEVTVERKNYPGLEANGSHLEDEACVPGFKDKDKVVFKFGLDECKTEQEEDGEAIYYKNKVIAIVKDEDDDSNITRSNTRVLPFQCSYKKKARLSKVQFNPQFTLFVTDAGNIKGFFQDDFARRDEIFGWLKRYIMGFEKVENRARV